MIRQTSEALVAKLTDLGLVFKAFSRTTEGPYQPQDATWNMIDVPHLNHVHEQADNVAGLIDETVVSTVLLQRLMGMTVPTVVVHYLVDDLTQVHYTSFFSFVMVTHIDVVATSATTSRVTSTYWIGARRPWMVLFPLIRWAISRNFDTLMGADLPMRERRGLLRARGFSFAGDDGSRTFLDTLDVEADRVIAPPDREFAAPSIVEPLTRIDTANGLLIGENDDRGLRLLRDRDALLAFPRICLHEGACIDEAPVEGRSIRCPWHGRVIGALGVLELVDGATATTPYHRISIVDGAVHLEPRDQPGDSPAISANEDETDR